jgi:hypothetical protein
MQNSQLIQLHKKATTTPAIRKYIRACGKGIKTLARELHLHPNTARKWRGREDAQDAISAAAQAAATLGPAQEALMAGCAATFAGLSLDDRPRSPTPTARPRAVPDEPGTACLCARLGRASRGQRHGRRCNGRIAELLASTGFRASSKLTTALGHYQALSLCLI